MNIDKAARVIGKFYEAVASRYGRADLEAGNAYDNDLGETVTVFWIGDRTRCVAAIRMQITLLKNLHILDSLIFDAPVCPMDLPRWGQYAFGRVIINHYRDLASEKLAEFRKYHMAGCRPDTEVHGLN